MASTCCLPLVTGLSNHRMQAPAGAAAVLNIHVGRSPAAPDAERYTCQEVKDNGKV